MNLTYADKPWVKHYDDGVAETVARARSPAGLVSCDRRPKKNRIRWQ